MTSLVPLKLCIVLAAVVGVFVLAGLGRITGAEAMGGVTVLVTGLTIALGIAEGGRAQAPDKLTAPPMPDVVNPPTAKAPEVP